MNNNSVKVLVSITAVSICLTLVGCGTLPTASLAPAIPMKEIRTESDADQALADLAKNLKHAKTPVDRLQAVSDARQALDDWLNSHSRNHERYADVDAAYERLKHFECLLLHETKVRTAEAALNAASTDEERLAAGNELVLCAADAISAAGWEPAAIVQLRDLQRQGVRARESTGFGIKAARAKSLCQEHTDFDSARQACQDARDAAVQALKQDVWTPMEQDNLADYIRGFNVAIANLDEQIESCRQLLQKQLDQAQCVFVNRNALSDITAAREIRNGQDGKWFNRFWMGHFRDDPQEFVKAVLLLDRINSDSRVDLVVRLDAIQLRNDCRGRLGRKGTDLYTQIPTMTSYRRMSDYPDKSPTEMLRIAKDEWNKIPQPRVAPGELPPGPPFIRDLDNAQPVMIYTIN